jgi:hypothetical protein
MAELAAGVVLRRLKREGFERAAQLEPTDQLGAGSSSHSSQTWENSSWAQSISVETRSHALRR